MFLYKSKNKRNNAAYTLVEVAIVLAIGGLIFSITFGTAKYIYGNNSAKNVLQQNFTIASNIQSQYAAVAPGQSPWGGGNITTTINNLGLLPGEMTNNGTCFQHALNGCFMVASGAALGDFTLQFQGISQAYCIYILLNLPLSDPGFGFKFVTIKPASASPQVTITSTGNGISVSPWPITPDLATTWCTSSNANELDIEYTIHP
jgi:prepilin-type N-terminal cleavage/methylation domain-containing protein